MHSAGRRSSRFKPMQNLSCGIGFIGDMGLLIFLIAYSVLGATMFHFIEAPLQQKAYLEELSLANQTIQAQIEDFCDLLNVSASKFVDYAKNQITPIPYTNSEVQIEDVGFNQYDTLLDGNETDFMSNCEDLLGSLLWENYWNLTAKYHKHRVKWTLSAAAVFCVTLYTTIGYGKLAAVSVAGRALTMVYALFGIPLLLLILARFGFHFSVLMNWCWKGWIRISGRHKKKRKKDELLLAAAGLSGNQFPITLAFMLTLAWIFASSAMFLLWEEDWDYFTCFYFSYISLTTIGLGDVTPAKPETMLTNFVFILIGLSMLSMCINLIQAKIETIAAEVMQLIRSRYRDTVRLGNSDMSAADCEEEVDRLLSKHSQGKWLAALVKRRKKQDLVNLYETAVSMKLAETQTEHNTKEIGCQYSIENHSISTQAFSADPTNTSPPLPLKECFIKPSSTELHEFRGMMRKVDTLLTDCRGILRPDDTSEDTSEHISSN